MSEKILSIDLGVTSCGFSVLENVGENSYKLIDYGVSMRDNPLSDNESPKKQYSEYKSKRELIKKRKKRVKEVVNLLKEFDISANTLKDNYDIWRLRAIDAYKKKLEVDEFIAIMKYLAKHRGYKSLKIEDLLREIEEQEKFKDSCENGAEVKKPKDLDDFAKTLAYLDALNRQNSDKSVATIIYELEEKNRVKTFRNHNNYRYMIRREDIQKEIEMIIDSQGRFGFFKSSVDLAVLKKSLIDIVIKQDPVTLNPDMINNCTIYKDEKTAPIYSFSYDVYRFYKIVNDLKIDDRSITEDEKEILYGYFLDKVNKVENIPHLTVKEIKKVLNLYDPRIKLNGLLEKKVVKSKEETTKLIKFNWIAKQKKFDKEIIKLINRSDKKRVFYDELATIIRLNVDPSKYISEVKGLFKKYDILDDEKKIKSFALNVYKNKVKGTGSFSFKAINELLTHMKDGKSESKAIELMGITYKEDYSSYKKGIKYLSLKSYEEDENIVTNHTVKSIVSFALRVIKHLTLKYGKFDTIKIESAKELSIPQKAKNAIEQSNKKREKEKEEIRKKYSKFKENLTSTDIKKLMLYEEQNFIAIYSGKTMGVSDVLSEKTEIEHIVPRSCGGSSTMYNLALELTDENAKKGNRLPLDYLSGSLKTDFERRVENMKEEGRIGYKKYKNLTAKSLDETFKDIKDDKNLHATSYAEKLLGEILKRYYPFKDEKAKNGIGVMHISGRATSHLRTFLKVKSKVRDTNFHHAEDAILLGVLSRSYLQKLSNIYRENYLKTEDESKKSLKDITPTIEGMDIRVLIDKLSKEFLKGDDKDPFYKNIDGTLRSISFWVNKKPIGTKAHDETIQSKKNFSYRVEVSKLIGGVKKPTYKTKAKDFIDDFNKNVYEKLLVTKINPKDPTAKAFARRRDEIAKLLEEANRAKTKEEQTKYNKMISELLNSKIYDINNNPIRRVKRVGEKVSVEVRNGLASTAKSLVFIEVTKEPSEKKLIFKRVDVKDISNKNYTKANQIKLYNNDLVEFFVEDKRVLKSKITAIVKGFTESGVRINLRNPKYPLHLDFQPKIYKEKFSIASTQGIKKYKLSIAGDVLGYYRLGRVLVGGKELYSDSVIYEDLKVS